MAPAICTSKQGYRPRCGFAGQARVRRGRKGAHSAISPHDIVGETFIAVSNTAPVTRKVVEDYLRRSGIDIKPDHESGTMIGEHDLVLASIHAREKYCRRPKTKELNGMPSAP